MLLFLLALTCQLADANVERAIAAKAKALDGHEYCQYRRYAQADFDGDGKDDLVVTFNVEGANGGGNNVESFLFVFLSSRTKPLEARAGGRGDYFTNGITADSKAITLYTEVWTKTDPLCCPTGRGKVRFAVDAKGGTLRRVP